MTTRAKKGSLKGLTCTVEGCCEPMQAKGMCRRHYKQAHRCGIATPGNARMHGTPEERFWRFVDRRNQNDCWNWTGHKDKDGYGTLRTPTSLLRAHRLAFEIHTGSIPSGLVVRHRCNNPSCVNPAHLTTGTHADNMADRIMAGNYPINEAHPNCKFSDDVVAAIRDAVGTYAQISKTFGISESQVGNIRRGDQRPAQARESHGGLFDAMDAA